MFDIAFVKEIIRQGNIINMSKSIMMSAMKRLGLASLTVALIMVAFSCNKLEEEVISRWPNGEIQKVYYYKTDGELRKKVMEERFYENGNQEMRGEYKDGVRHGNWIYWFEDGRKWTESEYENDLRIGQTIVWRENGFKNYEGMYSKGKPHGSWTFYDVDGSRVKEVLFEYGKKIKEIVYKEGVPFQLSPEDSASFQVH